MALQCYRVQDASSGWRRFHQGIEGMQEKAKDLSNEKVLCASELAMRILCHVLTRQEEHPLDYDYTYTSGAQVSFLEE